MFIVLNLPQIKVYAKQHSKWSAGETVISSAKDSYGGVYRKFIKKTTQGFLVQEFYLENNQASTSPFILIDEQDITRLPEAYYGDNVENNITINGQYERWYPNGKKAFQGQYLNGKRIGIWSFWDPVIGYKYLENHYLNGKLEGITKNWDANGVLISEMYAQQGHILILRSFDKHDTRISYWSEFHKNGKRMQSGVMKEDKREGLWIYWDAEGYKEADGYFKAGKRHGLWKTYWSKKEAKENETVVSIKRSEGEYSFGKKIGVWLYWDEEGLQTEKIYAPLN